MTDADFNPFAERLLALATMVDKTLTPEVVRGYFQALSEWPLEAVHRALETQLRESPFFPKVADLTKILRGGTLEERAERASGELERAISRVGPYQSVVFADRALTASIRDLGGWERVCGFTEEEWPFRMQEFRRLYAAYSRSGVPEHVPLQLAGIHERQGGYCFGKPAAENPALVGSGARELLQAAPKDCSGEVVAKLRKMNKMSEAAPDGPKGDPGRPEDTLGKL